MSQRDPMRGAVRFTAHPTLLTKVARCGSCGWRMTGVTGKSGRYQYYKCKKAAGFIDGGCAQPHTIPRDLLDKLVVDHLADIVFEPTRLRALLAEAIEAERTAGYEAPKQLDSLLRRKSDLDTRVSRLYKASNLGRSISMTHFSTIRSTVLRENAFALRLRLPRCGLPT
jgi:site-specific DNA recombinase